MNKHNEFFHRGLNSAQWVALDITFSGFAFFLRLSLPAKRERSQINVRLQNDARAAVSCSFIS
jgi:hypothetical protein